MTVLPYFTLEEILQLVSHSTGCVKEIPFDCPLGTLQGEGNLLQLLPVMVTQCEHQTLLRWEILQCQTDAIGKLPVEQVPVCLSIVVTYFGGRLCVMVSPLDRDEGGFFSTQGMGKADIDRYSMDPG
jgi:hypothetical protein